MSLRDQAKSISKERAKSRAERVETPAGEFEMRGMMAGDLYRVGETQQKHGLRRFVLEVVAICAHDPGTGEQVWNPNDGAALEEIAALDREIFKPLADAALRLSGLGEEEGAEGNASGPPRKTSSSPSPASSGGARSKSGAR